MNGVYTLVFVQGSRASSHGKHLELKGKKFSSFPLASEQDINFLWETVQVIDSTIERRIAHKEEPSFQAGTHSLFEALLQ